MTIHNVSHWSLPEEPMSIIEALERMGAIVYVIGGTPRNLWWGIEPNDLDLEVFGLSVRELLNALKTLGTVALVGQDFGIYDLTTASGLNMQVAIARRERQIGMSSADVEIVSDPFMLPSWAAQRRDFTINALYWRPTQQIVESFHHMTIRDLNKRILRPMGPGFEAEQFPLRPLRAMRLASEYNLTLSADHAKRWLSMYLRLSTRFDSIPKARLRAEWEKWAKSPNPAQGLVVLQEIGWLSCFPALFGMVVKQDPEWHPEGTAWDHTIQVVLAASYLATTNELFGTDRSTLIWAALLHDVGKAVTTQKATEGKNKGRWVSPGHDEAGVPIAKEFFAQMYDSTDTPFHKQVYALIRTHMRHINWQGGDSAVRKLAFEVGSIFMWYLLILADHSGRPFNGTIKFPENASHIVQRASAMSMSRIPPAAILMERHLIERGMKPGKEMGDLLRVAFDAQLNGDFTNIEEAIIWLENQNG